MQISFFILQKGSPYELIAVKILFRLDVYRQLEFRCKQQKNLLIICYKIIMELKFQKMLKNFGILNLIMLTKHQF